MKGQNILCQRSTLESDQWATPEKFFKHLDKRYKFVLDLACSKTNCKCRDGFTVEDNSLDQDWARVSMETRGGWLWLNPPYSQVKEFIDKCYFESTLGARIVALVPARTDTYWFHEYIYNQKGVSYDFVRGRLVFGTDNYWSWLWEQKTLIGSDGQPKENKLYKKYGKKNSAPFPSMVVVFDRNPSAEYWDVRRDVREYGN